jgi:uncharacterized protein (TIGR03067 family)
MRALALALLVGLIAFAAGCGKSAPTSQDGSGPPNPASADGEDKAAMQGTWGVAKFEMDVPPSEKDLFDVRGMMQSLEITIKDNLVTPVLKKEKDAGKDTFFVLTLNSSRSPKEVDLTESDEKGTPKPSKKFEFDPVTKQGMTTDGPPEVIRGIYKFEGDTLVVALGMGKTASRPTEFKPSTTQGKAGVVVFHFKKK